MRSRHIIIIGAGIVGACIAHTLSRKDLKVTIVDALAGPGLGVSAASFGWITCAAGSPESPDQVYRSRLESVDHYVSLDVEFGGRILAPSKGALIWGADEGETLEWAQRHEARGSQVRLVSRAEIAAMEPLIAAPPSLAAYFPRERAVDVREACALLVRSSIDFGSKVMFNCRIQGLETRNGRVAGVRLQDRIIAADQVIVAAGAQSPALIADAMPENGVTVSPAALITLSADNGRLAHVTKGGGLEIRSRKNGELIVAIGVENGPETPSKAMLAQEVLSKLQRLYPAIANPCVTSVEIGMRPFHDDDAPIVSAADEVEGLYLAVAHPGVILAPEMARMLADMVCEQDA